MDARKDRLIELLLLHAFQYRTEPPFVLASGATSPYYINCKAVTLRAEGLNLIGGLGYEAVSELGVAAVGGLTLGADPMACAIAMHSYGRSRRLSAFVVRKEAKGHGMARWLEGEVPAGTRVVIVEDVATTGASALLAIERAREAGLIVEDALLLVDREEGASEAIEAAGVRVRSILTRSELVARRQQALRHAAEAAALV